MLIVNQYPIPTNALIKIIVPINIILFMSNNCVIIYDTYLIIFFKVRTIFKNFISIFFFFVPLNHK